MNKNNKKMFSSPHEVDEPTEEGLSYEPSKYLQFDKLSNEEKKLFEKKTASYRFESQFELNQLVEEEKEEAELDYSLFDEPFDDEPKSNYSPRYEKNNTASSQNEPIEVNTRNTHQSSRYLTQLDEHESQDSVNFQRILKPVSLLRK